MNREDRQVALPRRAAYRLSAALLALVMLSGCGGSSETPQQEVVTAARDYEGAIVEGDGEAVCSALTGKAKRQLVEEAKVVVADCPAAVEKVVGLYGGDELGRLDQMRAKIEVDSVRLHGRNSATVDLPGGGQLKLKMVAGNWYVANTDSLSPESQTLIDDAKTETALQQNLRRSTGQKVSSVDCPSGVEVKAGTTFECTVELVGGGQQTVTLKILNSDADVEVTNLRPGG